ncbi:hypothetical protein [Candidatus Bathycorpusculum sp.]|uniref:hypothetical protein n=1 Tax=Candidatus Bathycorpusculum sp. TaxID=2994959 RepID=UPI002818CA95|nr:hypothetical protein [Candidatus Termitimicrobium sp.]
MASVAQLQAELANAQNALKAGTINQTQYNEFYRTQTVLIAQAKATEGSAVSPLPYDPTTGGARTGVTPGIGTSTGGQSTGNYVKVPGGGGYTVDYWQNERDNLSYQLQHGQISREEYDQRYDEYTGYMEQLGYSAPASNPLAEALDQQKNFDQALKDNVITPEEHATAIGKQGEIIKDIAGDMYKPPTDYKYNPPIIPGKASSSGTAFKPPEFTDEYVAKNSPDLFVGPMQNPQVGPVNLLPQTLLPAERIKIVSDAPPNADYLNAEAMIWLEQAKADRMLKQGNISAEQHADITTYLINTSKYNKDLYNAWVIDNYFTTKHGEMVKTWIDTGIVGASVIAATVTGGASLAAGASLTSIATNYGIAFGVGAGVSNVFNYFEHGEFLSVRDTVVAGAGSALFATVGGPVIKAGFGTVGKIGSILNSEVLKDISGLGLGNVFGAETLAASGFPGLKGAIGGGLVRASAWSGLAGGVGYVASGGNLQKTGFSVLTAFGGSLAFEGALGLYGRYVANRGGGGAGSGGGGRGGSGEGEWLLPGSAGGKGQTGGDVVLSGSGRLAAYNGDINNLLTSDLSSSIVGPVGIAPVAAGSITKSPGLNLDIVDSLAVSLSPLDAGTPNNILGVSPRSESSVNPIIDTPASGSGKTKPLIDLPDAGPHETGPPTTIDVPVTGPDFPITVITPPPPTTSPKSNPLVPGPSTPLDINLPHSPISPDSRSYGARKINLVEAPSPGRANYHYPEYLGKPGERRIYGSSRKRFTVMPKDYGLSRPEARRTPTTRSRVRRVGSGRVNVGELLGAMGGTTYGSESPGKPFDMQGGGDNKKPSHLRESESTLKDLSDSIVKPAPSRPRTNLNDFYRKQPTTTPKGRQTISPDNVADGVINGSGGTVQTTESLPKPIVTETITDATAVEYKPPVNIPRSRWTAQSRRRQSPTTTEAQPQQTQEQVRSPWELDQTGNPFLYQRNNPLFNAIYGRTTTSVMGRVNMRPNPLDAERARGESGINRTLMLRGMTTAEITRLYASEAWRRRVLGARPEERTASVINMRSNVDVTARVTPRSRHRELLGSQYLPTGVYDQPIETSSQRPETASIEQQMPQEKKSSVPSFIPAETQERGSVPVFDVPQIQEQSPKFDVPQIQQPALYIPTPQRQDPWSETTTGGSGSSPQSNPQSRLPFPVPWLPGIPGGSSQKPFNFRSGHVTKKTHAIPLPKDLLNQFGGKTKRVSLFGPLTSKQTKPVTRKRKSSSKKSGRRKRSKQ